MRPLLKVCGMTSGQNIRDVEQLGVDLMGFIFYPPSPRAVREIPSYLPTLASRVGVFVDCDMPHMLRTARLYGLDFIQLHGHESPDTCRALHEEGFKVIKAFAISIADDLNQAYGYDDGSCDMLLFDTKTSMHGGSGQQFDWSLLSDYSGQTPFLLSGGIDTGSAAHLKDFSHRRLAGYDINSRFETSPGIKDINLIKEFINNTLQ